MLNFNFPLYNTGYTASFSSCLIKQEHILRYLVSALLLVHNQLNWQNIYAVSLVITGLKHPNSVFYLQCETPNFSFTSLYHNPSPKQRKGGGKNIDVGLEI